MAQLPEPGCQYGYTAPQITAIFGAGEPGFWDWMTGQTSCMCDGRRYNYESGEYEPNGCERAHGHVVYEHDVRRYLVGLAPLD